MVMCEIKPIGKALIFKAKKGDVAAIRELFDRAFGKVPQSAKIDLLDERLPVPILNGITFQDMSEPASIYGGLSAKPK